MVPIPYMEHFSIKGFRFASPCNNSSNFLPQRPPRCFNKRDKDLLTLSICGGNKKHFLPLHVAHLKGLLHFEYMNLQHKPDNGHGHEPTQRNVHPIFSFWVDLEFLYDLVCVDLVLVLDPLDKILT